MPVTRARLPMLVGVLMAVSLVAAGCGNGDSAGDPGTGGLKDVVRSHDTQPDVPKPAVHTNVARGATAVPVDRVYRRPWPRHPTAVNVTSRSGPVPGTMSADNKTWTAGTLLDPGTTYTLRSQASIEGGSALPGSPVSGPWR